MSARLRWGAAIAIGFALLIAPSAHATLAFVRGPLDPTVWAAADDGSAQRRVDKGSTPHVSPDGQTIAYMRLGEGRSFRPELMVAPADGSAPPRRLLNGWREPFTFAWSPDSKTIAAVGGPELGRTHLALVDVATGGQRAVARGYFDGVSFSPGGEAIAYGRAPRERFPRRSDVFRAALGGGSPTRLTHDRRSLSPLWGPGGRIVFVKQLGAKKRRFGPKNELFLMDGDGSKVRRLTHTKVDPLLAGLYPTDWSADGGRLLAEFEGQDTSYAVAVNPRTGAQHPVAKAGERGLVGAALSADGSSVLGFTGGFEPGPGHEVVSVPYAGGRAKVLARNAFEPAWSR